jgi:hypothetical protein
MSKEQREEDSLTYPGTSIEPEIGDQVRFHDELLTLENMIDSEPKQHKWGARESGLMLVGGSFGRVFTALTDSHLRFVSRAIEKDS